MFVGGGANPDAYNKETKEGKGTLILNWYEEDVLRQTTGERRALGHGHVSKNHDDLFRKTGDELQHVYEKSAAGGDQTFDRLFGRRRQPSYATEQQEKYVGAAPLKTNTGRKDQLIEQQFLNQIGNELNHKNQEAERIHNERNFTTTYKNEYLNKPNYQNTVGRRVMRDQNGFAVAPENRDVDLLVEHGFLKPTSVLPDDELRNIVKKDNYASAQPITFYTEKQNDGTFYATKANSQQGAFNKNNDFAKTFTTYKNRIL